MGSYPKQNPSEKTFSHEAEDDSACLFAMQLCFDQIHTAVLNAALELNLFDIIAKATPPAAAAPVPISASEIASQLPTQHHHLSSRLDRMLCLLATHSLLTCSSREKEDGGTEILYALSPAGKYFANENDENGGSYASFFKYLCQPAISKPLFKFKEGIVDVDNDVFKKAHGMSMYQYTEMNPTWNQIFNKAMADTSKRLMTRVLEIYKGFEGISTLVDVGGGIGQNLKLIISKYPSIKGINFDLPQVVQNAPPYEGIEHVGGDMFASIPNGDAIIFKGVLHNWSDERCVKALSNCHKALSPNGKVIIMDCVVPDSIEPTSAGKLAYGLDNLMFIQDGRERREKEFETLCKSSGFSGFKVVCRAFAVFGVIEFYK